MWKWKKICVKKNDTEISFIFSSAEKTIPVCDLIFWHIICLYITYLVWPKFELSWKKQRCHVTSQSSHFFGPPCTVYIHTYIHTYMHTYTLSPFSIACWTLASRLQCSASVCYHCLAGRRPSLGTGARGKSPDNSGRADSLIRRVVGKQYLYLYIVICLLTNDEPVGQSSCYSSQSAYTRSSTRLMRRVLMSFIPVAVVVGIVQVKRTL